MDFTQYNKAIVGFVMFVIAVANSIWPGAIGLDETTVNLFVAAVTPVLVYLIPNKKTP